MDIHAAEDVSSEAMLAFLRNIHEFEADAPNVGGWLRSVVDFKVADHFRKQLRNRDRLQYLAKQPTHREVSAPSAALEIGETRDHVLKVLDQLPGRHREVLECKYLDAMSVREIASRLGETEKAVESLLYRGRCEFRRLFDLPAPPTATSLPQPQIEADAESQS
jgi:RNA polymerase sigma factor (sigma-70 family)